MTKVIKWVEDRCPECGSENKHPKDFKLATCNKFECVQRHVHPEVKRRR